MKFIINDLNLKKQAEDLGIKTWQTPGFIFIMIGIIAVAVMTAIYFISKNYNDPKILIIAECLVVSMILVAGTSLVRLVEQITKLNRMKNEFVAVASHQLRTPLSAMKWEAELLLTKFRKGLSEKQLGKLENISLLSQRMTRLVNDLLDVARIDQDRLMLKKQKFDLAKIMEEVVGGFSPAMKMRNIEIVLDVKKNLPMVLADPDKIKLVVENLVNNAVKYTTSGGKVEIKLLRDGDKVVFEIKDNGVGIPEEQIDRVFEKFFRSDNAVKYQTEGTGLGLYIAKNIVDQSGGVLWFQSIENIGSVFSFSLPIG